MTQKEWNFPLSTAQAAEYLGLQPRTVRYHVYTSGYLTPEKVGHDLRFSEECLEAYLSGGKQRLKRRLNDGQQV